MTSRVKSNSVGVSERAYDFPGSGLIQVNFERFKAFKERVEVDLAPITVVAGVNSGGKTTILQSLLLARQSLITPYRSSQEDALIYNGELVRFSDFNELIFGKPEDAEEGVRLGFSFIHRDRLLFDLDYLKLFHRFDIPLSIKESIIEVDLLFGYDKIQKIVRVNQILLQSSFYDEVIEHKGPRFIFEREHENWKISYKWKEESLEIVSNKVSFERFIPIWINELGSIMPYEQVKVLYPLFSENFVSNLYKICFEESFDLFRKIIKEQIFYVGPLRTAPQRTYLRQRVIGLDVGASGEYTIQLLHERQEEEVVFVELPPDLEAFKPTQLQPKTMKLRQAVQESLRLLGLEQILKIDKLGESFEAMFSLHKKPGTFVSIEEVGFGVSQILPIIAICLLSPPGSILMFEQPEIHLHPRAQAGLAELFLCMGCTNRRVLVETHSDHLINRLRRRVAEDKSSKTEKWVNILFVHPPKSAEDGATVERGRINKYGDIENWPAGFLAESAKDARAIILAGSEKRREERKNLKN